MKIRGSLPEDAPAIAAIWNDVIDNTSATFTTARKAEADLAASIVEAPDRWWSLERDGAVVGFATFFPFRSGPGYRHTFEHTIHLSPVAQGKGFGRSLMEMTEAAAKNAGAHSLFAGVSGENEAGIKFHRAIGYSEVARLPQVGRKFDRWMDLVLLQKFL